MKKTFLFLVAAMVVATASAADKVTVTVSNSLKTARSGELVEVDAAKVKSLLGATSIVVKDADGREVPSQITYDGKLIFQVGVAAKGKSIYYVSEGTPAEYEPKVFGRQFPERVDDIAWENDVVAYRCYGPALQRNGEKAYGYDVWNKRTSKLVVEERYANELNPDIQRAMAKLRSLSEGDLADDIYNAVSYHVDHGNGMDCYKVGSTLGCGTSALLDSKGNIVYPYCYVDYDILDKGPLRFTVRLQYGKETVDGVEVTETRVVSLDAGSHLNKAVVSYKGMTKALPFASGIVIHNENQKGFFLNPELGYMGYEDRGDPNQYKEKYRYEQNDDFGKIFVGVVMPQAGVKMEYKEEKGLPGATGHILASTTLQPETAITYYFGSGWNRNPETDILSLTDWEAYLSLFSELVKSPLKVTIK